MQETTIKLCCEFFHKRSWSEPWQKFVMDLGPETIYTHHPKIKKTTLQDCRSGDNVFFMMLCTPDETMSYLSQKDQSFFDHLNSLKAKILLNHEGFNLFTWDDNIFDHPFAIDVREHLYWKLKLFLESKGISEDRLYFIHSAKGYLQEIRTMSKRKVQWFDAPYYVRSKHLHLPLYLPWANSVNVEARRIDFRYHYAALYGGRQTQFRYDIVRSLWKRNLLDKGKVSLKIFDGGDKEFEKILPITYDSNYDLHQHDAYQQDSAYESYVFEDVFLWAVAETLMPNNYPNFSEKTIRGILFERPFVILGNPGTLKFLRELGFKTFGDFWDESYDDEKNLDLRIKKFVEVIAGICEQKDLNSLYDKLQPIVSHNKMICTQKNYLQIVYDFLTDQIKDDSVYWSGQNNE